MKLVDLQSIKEQIGCEPAEVDIENAARNLRGVKQMMGPVTVIWYDYIIYNAVKVEPAEMRRLVEFAEKDIRTGVKKDKTKVCYAVIAAYFGLKMGSLKDFALAYVEHLGLDLNVLNELSDLPAEEAVWHIMEYVLPLEIRSILQKITFEERVNFFKRYARRSSSQIAGRLEQALDLFRREVC